jgi:hypothetical protein
LETPESDGTSQPVPPIVHIYAPRYPHDAVEIFGNKCGLENVINAIIDAISVGAGEGRICSSDGSHSELRTACLEVRRRPEEWTRSGSPYWDIDDPYVARIVQLTEENGRLRRALAALRLEREPIVNADSLEGTETGTGTDGPFAPG